jgi:hypothetical protein
MLPPIADLIADKHGQLDPWLSHQIYYFIIIVTRIFYVPSARASHVSNVSIGITIWDVVFINIFLSSSDLVCFE